MSRRWYRFLWVTAMVAFAGTMVAQERTAPVKDELRERYTQSDHEKYLKMIQEGKVPKQGGPVAPSRTLDADVLVNNNNGGQADRSFIQSEQDIIAFGNFVVVAFNDAGSYTGSNNQFTGWSYSTNGGISFTDGGTLPTSTIGDAGDPVLARNETTGRIYLSTLGFASPGTIQMWRSDDNGVSWMAPVVATPGGSSEDKQWHTVDNFPGTGNGNVYVISRNFGSGSGIYVYRSTNNGDSFIPNAGVNIVSGQQGGFIAVGPDHSVYAFWFNGTTLQMRRSTDFGATFSPAVVVTSGLIGGTNGDLGLTGIRQGTSTASSFRSSEFPHVAISPITGYIYVTFDNKGAGTDKADVFLVQSTDNGATWSSPLKINDDVTTTDQWQPTIAVTPSGSQIGIFYYSRQEDAANNLFKFYGRIGNIAGTNIVWQPSFPVSDVASLPEFGRDAVVNSVYMSDYSHVYATQAAFHVVWSDNRDDWTLGPPRKDPNVYYKKIATTQNFGWVRGTVTSTQGGAPVRDINIDFVESVVQVGSFTDSLGRYFAGVRVDSPATTANVTLRARKFGYVDTTVAVTITRNDTLTRNFAIRPAPGGTLSVFSHTATTNLRSYVEVKFGTLTVISDSTNGTTGLLSAPLPAGTYSVRVDARSPYATRVFPSVVINAGATTNIDALTQSVVTNNPAAMRDTLAVAQTHGKTLQLTNTTADTVPWRLSVDEGTLKPYTPSELKQIARSKEQQPSYVLAKGAVDPNSEPMGIDGRGGPDAFGYVWIDSDEPGGPTFNWVDITGVGTPVTTWSGGTDDGSFSTTLPWPFPFYGSTYTNFFFTTNGWLGFGSPSTQYSNVAIPSTALPNNAIYPFWDDLQVTGTSGARTVYYYNDAANSRFIVQWNAVQHLSTAGDTLTFQAILKQNGEILVQYLNMVGTSTLTSATIGIENGTGTVGLQVVFNASYVHNNLALLFKMRGVSWLNYTPSFGSLAPGASQNVTGTFDATGLTAGTTYNGTTYLDVTHPDVQGSITIPSSLRVQSAAGKVISVSPLTLTLPSTPIGSTSRDSVRVRSIGDQSVTISSVTTTNPRFVATATSTVIAAGDSARIRVVYTPTLPAGTDTGRVIILSDATTPRVDVMLTGTALAVAGIVVSPDSFYFSLPQVSDTTTATLKIRNPGTDSLRYNINEATDEFSFASGERPVQTGFYEPLDLPKEARDPRAGIGGTDGQGGPDAFGYRWIDSDEPGGPTFSWIDMSTTGTRADTSQFIKTGTFARTDEGYLPVLLPFSFSYYGVPKDTLFIGTNGNVMFQRPTADIFTNAAFPTAGGGIDNHIGVFWDDLNLNGSSSGKIFYGMNGGNFVVHFDSIGLYATPNTPNYTFEVILSPGGQIKTQYRNMGINGGTLTSASIGIENATGTVGLGVVFNAAYLHNNLAIVFTSDLLPWISTNRTSGTIAPGDSQNVQLRVVPNQPTGTYVGHLRITGNTPTVANVGIRLDVTAPPSPGWTSQTSGITTYLYSVRAVSYNVGWAAGAGGRVLRTTNNGTTWASVGGGAIGTADIYNIDAIDANNAWVTTSPAATFIYRTTNGGASWTQVYTDASSGAFINAIKMFNATNGIAYGDPVGGKWVILYTSNGGSSWTRDTVNAPLQVGGETGTQNGLSAVGSTNVWFCSGVGGRVYRTTNGGGSWTSSAAPFAGTSNVWFNNAQVGLVSYSTGNNLARSTDGGATWTSVATTGTGFMIAVAGSGYDDFWYARGTTIYRSTDRGQTFASSFVGTGTYVGLNFATSGSQATGWAVTSTGGIAKAFFNSTGAEEQESGIPQAFALMQNYPNPFNPTTTIQYALPQDAFVTLKVYDILGQEVVQLRDEMESVGNHTVVWNGRNKSGSQVASGIYFYRIEAKPANGAVFTSLKKMILLK